MPIYLYVKTHKKTGLKYLGKTEQDPYRYGGSGSYWVKHLKKHGSDVHTDILLATESSEELRETGLFFSKIWNIVESEDWANLVPEEGEGGHNLKHLKRTPEWNRKVGLAGKGREPHNKAKKCWNNGANNIFSDICPGDDYIEGIFRPNYVQGKGSAGMKWFTNGKENALGFEPPEGFIPGRIQTKPNPNKGKKTGFTWWNDGNESKLFDKDPGRPWVKGRLKWF